MSLYFRNDTSKRLYMVFAFKDENCAGPTHLRKRGWTILEPGQTKNLMTENVKYLRYYWYAEDVNRQFVWSGNNFTHIPDFGFNACWHADAPGGRILGLREYVPQLENEIVPIYIIS